MKRIITTITLILLLTTMMHAQPQGQWTWMCGDSIKIGNPAHPPNPQIGVFNSINAPNSGSFEGAWKDLNGNFWYGGSTLMEFNPLINQWAFISKIVNQSPKGFYGIQNVGDTLNRPGSRYKCFSTWVDTSGDLWLFGGYGLDKDSAIGSLNDLWKYNIATKKWTWVAGSDTVNDPGHYGTIMVPSSTNNPPARYNTTVAWTDNNNCLWLFGGFKQYGNAGRFADLWKYDIAAHQWTWMKGPNTLDQPAVYGTMGVPNASNVPSSRFCYAHWKDSHGNFWLFGGSSFGSTLITLNDMWRFNPSTNEWTWMSGTSIDNNTGTGTTHCNPSGSYNPPSRFENSAYWTLPCDNFVMFGGSIDSSTSNSSNDLWSYSVNNNKWTLMSGTLNPDDTGHFGSKTVSSPLNLPGSRAGSVGWTDGSGNLWMFGGISIHNARNFGDMWRFVPDTTCPHKCISSGIEEITLNKNEVSVYPNPASTILNIHHSTYTPNETLLITDLLGNEVYKETLTGIDNSISISKWSNGVYFYEVRGEKGSVRGKFVVQK